ERAHGGRDPVDAARGEERRRAQDGQGSNHNAPCKRSVQVSLARLVGTPLVSRPSSLRLTSYSKRRRACVGRPSLSGKVSPASGENVRTVCETGRRTPPWRDDLSPLDGS